MRFIVGFFIFVSWLAHAELPPYYINLSKETNVPVDVLFALAYTETDTLLDNGEVLPWPYTINLNGKSEYFSKSEAMLERAANLVKQGVIHFDCGLFQVNWKWNGRYRANNLTEACSPKSNGIIASNIIKEYFVKTGNWIEAAGKYHNPANKNGAADIYKRRFRTNLVYAQKVMKIND